MLEVNIQARLKGFELCVAFRADQEIITLFGPSGSGKSLTLRCIAGLLTPEEGHISVNGRTVFGADGRTNARPQQRRVGYVFQNYALFPHLTVEQNLAYGLTAIPRDLAREKVAEMVKVMRLRGLERRKPRELSGGQQQRVAVGRALITEPEILLLDEPFSALDSVIRGKLTEDLLELHRQFPLTTVFVTHDLSEAYTLSDRIVVLEGGRVLQEGRKEDVLQRPTSLEVARLVGIRNVFEGEVIAAESTGLRLDAGRFTVPAPPGCWQVGQRVHFCVRPENITLVRPGRGDRSRYVETQIDGWIVREVNHGAVHTLFFKLGTEEPCWYRDYDLEIRVASHAYEVLGVSAQKRWIVSLKQQAIHVIGG
ncbi:MAG: ABC transporter ATP-binding protein [Chloroflexota bacterium]|nr:MAG: ABC transporter ATP-binding protein [Chloroflexota bacterium]